MKKNIHNGKRIPTFLESISPILFMAITIIIGKGIFDVPIEICLIIPTIFAGIIANKRLNYNWKSLEKMIIEKIYIIIPQVLIVIFIGFMISSWCFSGTLPMMVYYGMKIALPKYLIVISYLLSIILSYVSGTSWGAVASIGVAMMSIGDVLEINLAILASSVITGAYFGDKLSPLSDSTNLAASVAKIPIHDHIKYMSWTMVPSAIIAFFFYFIIGINTRMSGNITAASVQMLNQLKTIYNFKTMIVLPMIIVLLGTFLRLPTIPVMVTSGFIGVMIGVFYQNFPITLGLKSLICGIEMERLTNSNNLSPSILDLLNRGGLANNGGFITFVLCSMGFAGIVTGTGMLYVLINPVIKLINNIGVLVLITEIECVVISLLTGSDGLTKIIPGELMTKKFLDLRVHPKVLARTTEDAGTMVCPIVPWSAAGIYMVSTLGVPVIEYLPYCILFFSSMIIAAIYAFTGIGIIRITDDEAVKMARERGIILKEFE